MLKKTFILLCPVILLIAIATCVPASDPRNPGPTPEESKLLPAIKIDKRPVKVELVFSDDDRAKGLMFRQQLLPDHGMLFVYNNPRELSFWMKNTVLPLDIAFIDENGKILNILQMRPNDDRTRYVSNGMAMYALEVEQGWFEKNKIKAGAVVDLGEVKKALEGKKIE